VGEAGGTGAGGKKNAAPSVKGSGTGGAKVVKTASTPAKDSDAGFSLAGSSLADLEVKGK
jgi:hypothetical protein